MAIISTTSFSIVPDTDQIFTLNKTELAAIITDSNWNDTSGWSSVTAFYESLVSQDSVKIVFDLTTNDGIFSLSDKAVQGGMILKRLDIRNFDGGRLPIMFGRIPGASGFQVTVGLGGGGPTYFFSQEVTDGSAMKIDTGPSISPEDSIRQEWTPSSNVSVAKINVNCRKVGSPTGQITIYILEDVDGSPTNVGSYALNAEDFPTSFDFAEFVPATSPIEFNSIYKYEFVIEPPAFGGSLDGSNYVEFSASSSDTIPSHVLRHQYNSVTTVQAGDLAFRIVDVPTITHINSAILFADNQSIRTVSAGGLAQGSGDRVFHIWYRHDVTQSLGNYNVLLCEHVTGDALLIGPSGDLIARSGPSTLTTLVSGNTLIDGNMHCISIRGGTSVVEVMIDGVATSAPANTADMRFYTTIGGDLYNPTLNFSCKGYIYHVDAFTFTGSSAVQSHLAAYYSEVYGLANPDFNNYSVAVVPDINQMVYTSVTCGDDAGDTTSIVQNVQGQALRDLQYYIGAASSSGINYAAPAVPSSVFSASLKHSTIVLTNSDRTARNSYTVNDSTLHTNYVDGGSFLISGGGKYYCELTNDQAGTTSSYGPVNGVGVSFSSAALPTVFANPAAFAETGENIYIAANTPNIVRDGGIIGAGFTIAEGDVIGIALDLDNQLAYYNKNGTWYGAGGSSNADIGLVTGIDFSTAQTYVHVGAIISHEFNLGAGLGGQMSIVESPANTPAGYTVI